MKGKQIGSAVGQKPRFNGDGFQSGVRSFEQLRYEHTTAAGITPGLSVVCNSYVRKGAARETKGVVIIDSLFTNAN